jgi:hypothetical protein
MAVIPFPSVNPRHLTTNGLRAPRRPSPPVHLSVDDVHALTNEDFFHCIQTDADNGTAIVDDDAAPRLVQYLDLHGLRLPSAVNAAQLKELCNDLRWTYGRAVRLAAQGRTDIAHECPGLTTAKIAYALAVASQERSRSRDLARQVFTDRASLVFLY